MKRWLSLLVCVYLSFAIINAMKQESGTMPFLYYKKSKSHPELFVSNNPKSDDALFNCIKKIDATITQHCIKNTLYLGFASGISAYVMGTPVTHNDLLFNQATTCDLDYYNTAHYIAAVSVILAGFFTCLRLSAKAIAMFNYH
jgi:hypothetical protein